MAWRVKIPNKRWQHFDHRCYFLKFIFNTFWLTKGVYIFSGSMNSLGVFVNCVNPKIHMIHIEKRKREISKNSKCWKILRIWQERRHGAAFLTRRRNLKGTVRTVMVLNYRITNNIFHFFDQN